MAQELDQNIINGLSDMPVPKYYRLKVDILNKINSGELADDQKLPSENELCRQYGISRITVRKTFDELVRGKFIYKVHGKGTYVVPKAAREKESDISKQSVGCTDFIRRHGMMPSTKINFCQDVQCPEQLLPVLGLKQGDKVMAYVRTYYADGQPLIYAKSFINTRFLPELEGADFTKVSFSDVVTSNGYTINRQRHIIKAILAEGDMIENLKVDATTPLLYREIRCTATNSVVTFPLEVSSLYCRTDIIPFSL